MAIDWSPVAKFQLQENLRYARLTFGLKTAQRWAESVERIEQRLRQAPESFPLEPLLLTNPRHYRGASIMKHFRIVYYCDKSRGIVHIMRIWDSRMSPQKLTDDLA
jgi:plasmid stabilization system protein ParE